MPVSLIQTVQTHPLWWAVRIILIIRRNLFVQRHSSAKAEGKSARVVMRIFADIYSCYLLPKDEGKDHLVTYQVPFISDPLKLSTHATNGGNRYSRSVTWSYNVLPYNIRRAVVTSRKKLLCMLYCWQVGRPASGGWVRQTTSTDHGRLTSPWIDLHLPT